MKFKDIPKFTRVAHYKVDIPFDYIKRTIDSYIKEYKLQMEPEFQRGHVWTREQQIAYVEYILRGGRSGRDIYFNSPTWQSPEVADGGYDEFVLVDGLQRLTAIMAFLDNKIPVFGYYHDDFEDMNRMPMEYFLSFHVNDLKKESEVLTWYIEMNAGGTPHTKEEIERVRVLLNAVKSKEA